MPIVMLCSIPTDLAKEILAKKLFKNGRHPNRILIELSAKRKDSKGIYIDRGVLQIEGGCLVFEGVDSDFRLPLGDAASRSFFDTDCNYSSLRIDVESADLSISIRQKWNWNEGYRLGDLHEEMKSDIDGISEGQVETILPPEANSDVFRPWFEIAAYSMLAMGLAATVATVYRTVCRIDTDMGVRATWTISIFMLLAGLLAVILIRRSGVVDDRPSHLNQN